jgi:hypothetical protein
MIDKYILDGHEPVICNDLIKWARFFENVKNRSVAFHEGDTFQVSTVFIGLNHPGLFETMVFDGALDGEEGRASTWDEAVKMHEDMVSRCIKKEKEST